MNDDEDLVITITNPKSELYKILSRFADEMRSKR